MKRLVIFFYMINCISTTATDQQSLSTLRVAHIDEVDTAQLTRLTYLYCAIAGFIANMHGNTTRAKLKNNTAAIATLIGASTVATLAAPNKDRQDFQALLNDLARHQLPHIAITAAAGYLTGAITARVIVRPCLRMWSKKAKPTFTQRA